MTAREVRGLTWETSVMINSSFSEWVFHDSPIRFSARVSDEIFGPFFQFFLGQNHTGLSRSVIFQVDIRIKFS